MVTASDIQHTRLKGEKPFQDFCLKLARRYWNDDYAQLHGRKGQSQNGADITGSDRRNHYANAAMQCKGSDKNEQRQLSESELIEEIEAAKTYTPKLDVFIVAYAGDRNEALQKKANELSEKNKKAGLFKVVLWSWDDIVERALDFPEVADELMVRNQVPLATALDPKRPRAFLPDVESAIRSLVASLEPPVPNDTHGEGKADPIAEGKIDVLRDQILAGSGPTVAPALQDFINGLPNDTHPHVRFRAYANLGAALIQAGQFESATIAFDEAANAEPGTASSHAYKARVALANDNHDLAHKEAKAALAIDPKHVLGAMCLAEASRLETATSELEAQLGELARDIDIGAVLSRRYSLESAHKDAIRTARNISAKGWQRDTILAQAILHGFEGNVDAQIGAPLPSEDSLLITEAKSLLKAAWPAVKARGDAKNWKHVGANLVSAYRLSGDEASADEVALDAIAIDPSSVPLMERAVLANMHRGNDAEVKRLSEKLAASGSFESILLAATASTSVSDWNGAERWAYQVFRGSTDSHTKGRAAELLILAKQQKVGADAALELANQLRPDIPSSITFESRVAETARRAGDNAALSEATKNLEAISADSLNAFEKFELADARADGGDWVGAAKLLSGLYTLDRPSELLRRHLFALYRADLRSEARELYESLAPSALRSAQVRRLGAAIYERSGMLAQALRELSAAIDLDPAALGTRLDWARLATRSGEGKRVAKWIRKASIDVDGGPEELLEFAQLLERHDRRKDALELGYRTLSRHWGASERLHMMYMALFLMRQRKDRFIDIHKVDVDSVVFVENTGGGKAHFRIEANTGPSPDVLPPDHPFAKKLLGTEVGDTVTLDQGIGEPVVWSVVEIKHKYLDLFHRAFEAHDIAFPGSKVLGRFQIATGGDDALKPLFEQARERSRIVTETLDVYRQGIIPLETVGKMLGIDAIDVSRGLRFHYQLRLDTCIGTAEERIPILTKLSDVRVLLVEPMTLGVWQEIGLLPILEKLSNLKFQAVQATIDVLAARYEQAQGEIGSRGGSLEATDDGKLRMVQQSKAERKVSADSCEDLLIWCRQHAAIVPTDPLVVSDRGAMERVLTRAGMGTLGTSVASKTPLAVEDRRLRGLATSLGCEVATWTQPLLMTLRQQGHVSLEEYTRLIANLAEKRIGFVSVGSDELKLAGKRADLSHEFAVLIHTVAEPTVDARSLLPVLIDFIVDLWADRSRKWERDKLASALLRLLLARPDGIELFRIIATRVRKEISALVFPENIIARWWVEYIDHFMDGHFIRGAVLPN